MNQQTMPTEVKPVVKTPWPFPVVNAQRTEESQKLLDTKFKSSVKSKLDDCSDFPDATF